MRLVLTTGSTRGNPLGRIYASAIREATDLVIASAYLTDWDDSVPVGRICKSVLFIVGTDFGLTRKAAMRSVLRWLPKHGSCSFLAAPRTVTGGFHPKVLAWRSKNGRHYAVTGSSNLSRAAFTGNYEANVFSAITPREYSAIQEWLEPVILKSTPVTDDWIDHHYREAPFRKGGAATDAGVPPVKLNLPNGSSYESSVRARRAQQAAFREIRPALLTAVRRCAFGELGNSQFWRRFWGLWSEHKSRFQGSGLQFSGKSANWRQACSALAAILDIAEAHSSQSTLDAAVVQQVDRLAQLRNPARGAWLSEMLCHFLPHLYPIWNNPVRKWLKANKWRGRRGASEGQRYVELARQLRYSLASRPAGARNLAELDAALWLWVYYRGL